MEGGAVHRTIGTHQYMILACDGSYSPPTNKIGYSVVIEYDDFYRIFYGPMKLPGIKHTSQSAEVYALYRALSHAKTLLDPEILSDSVYCVNGYNQWLDHWIEIDFKGKAYGSLWKKIHKIKVSHPQIKVSYVKGHSGIKINEISDKYARIGSGSGITRRKEISK